MYEEKELNQNLFDKAKNLERTKDIDGNPEITLIFNVLISPLDREVFDQPVKRSLLFFVY